MSVLQEISEALIVGNAKKVEELAKQALDQGVAPGQVIREGLIPGMSVVGERFKKNEVYVPEVLIAARAMHAGMGVVKPLLTDADAAQRTGVAVIGTVKGDLHDIGKNLVAMMMEGAGYEVVDLGVDVAPEKFIEAVKDNQATHLLLSALLTTTMVSMKDVVDAVAEAGLRDKVKILIGGAPVTQSYCEEIGADGYAPDASTAVDVAKEVVS